MDSRRRTLAASGSSLPIPSSTPRPRQSMAPASTSQSNRQSLAPNRAPLAGRGSIAGYPPPLGGSSQESQGSQLFSQGHGGAAMREAPATVGRSTNMYSSMGSMSVNRGGAMRTGMDYPASERRTSTYGGRRQTFSASVSTPLGAGPLQSFPRPLKDSRDNKSIENRKRYASEIVAFLNGLSFVGPKGEAATEKHLLQPTGTQFASYFKFIVGAFDPTINFTGAKFEDNVVPVLQACLYPFAQSITKSHLQSIGSQQSWPNMLAMLNWLVDSIQVREAAFENSPALHIPEPPWEDDEEDQRDHKEMTTAAWFDFISELYPKWIAFDDYEPAAELEVFFNQLEAGRVRLRERCAESEEEAKRIAKEWEELVALPDPLVEAKAEQESAERDVVRLTEYTNKIKARLAQQKATFKTQTERKEAYRKEREGTQTRIKQLAALIDTQGMSPVEIQNINSEQTVLSTQQQAIIKKQQAKLEATMNLEVELAKAHERANGLCAVYQTKATQLGVLPQPPEGFEHVAFEQEINGAADNPVPDLTQVKPALIELRSREKVAWTKMKEEDVILEEKITRAKENIAELKEIVEADEVELDNVERDNLDLKETTNAEHASSMADIERLQANVNNLQSTMAQPLVIATHRYEQRRQELDAELLEAAEVRRVNRLALENELGDILAYKEHMVKQTSLIFDLAHADSGKLGEL